MVSRKNSDITDQRGIQNIEEQKEQKSIRRRSIDKKEENEEQKNYLGTSQSRLLAKQFMNMATFRSIEIPSNEKIIKSKRKKDDEEDEAFNEEEQEYHQKEDNEQNQIVLPKEFVVLEVLGKGGQGSVATFLDKKNNSVIALKEFKTQNEYDNESSTYRFLRNRTELHQYVNLMIDEDKTKKQIQLQMGSCSLYELYLAMKGFSRWDEINLIKIFLQMASGILAFRKLGFYHGDIKPQNVMLFPQENTYNAYMIKFIDFGGSGFDNNEYFSFYSPLFCSNFYFNQVDKDSKILTNEEVTICEIYSLVRTIRFITCFSQEEEISFKQINPVKIGIEFPVKNYPVLSKIVQNIIESNGDLKKIEQEIKIGKQILQGYSVKNDKNKIDEVDIEVEMLLKFKEEEKDMILGVIQRKKNRFLCGLKTEELEVLFEFFLSLGLDQRAIEIFHQLELPYEKIFQGLIREGHLKESKMNQESVNLYQTINDVKQQDQNNFSVETQKILNKLNKEEGIKDSTSQHCLILDNKDEKQIRKKVSIIKESIILLNEKGEIERGIKWNRILIGFFDVGSSKNIKEVILQKVQYAILLNSRGLVQQSLEIAKEARKNYKKYLQEQSLGSKEIFLEAKKVDIIYGQICEVIGRLYAEMDSLSNALKILKEALLIFQSIKENKVKIGNNSKDNFISLDTVEDRELDNLILQSLIKLSQASSLLKQSKKALEYVNKALELSFQMFGERENKHVAMCLNIKSIIFKEQKEFEKALHQQKECLRIRQQIHNGIDNRCVATSLNQISILNMKLGKCEEALINQEHCYQMRLRLYSRENPFHKQISNCLSNFGLIYQAQGKMDEAEKFYLQSYEMTVQSKDIHQQMNALRGVISITKATNQKDKQKYYTEKSISIKQEVDEMRNLILQKNFSNGSVNTERCSRKQSEQLEELSPKKQSQYSLSHLDQNKLDNQESLGSTVSQESENNFSSSQSSTNTNKNKNFQGNKSRNKRYGSLKSNLPSSLISKESKKSQESEKKSEEDQITSNSNLDSEKKSSSSSLSSKTLKKQRTSKKGIKRNRQKVSDEDVESESQNEKNENDSSLKLQKLKSLQINEQIEHDEGVKQPTILKKGKSVDMKLINNNNNSRVNLPQRNIAKKKSIQKDQKQMSQIITKEDEDESLSN